MRRPTTHQVNAALLQGAARFAPFRTDLSGRCNVCRKYATVATFVGVGPFRVPICAACAKPPSFVMDEGEPFEMDGE